MLEDKSTSASMEVLANIKRHLYIAMCVQSAMYDDCVESGKISPLCIRRKYCLSIVFSFITGI